MYIYIYIYIYINIHVEWVTTSGAEPLEKIYNLRGREHFVNFVKYLPPFTIGGWRVVFK